MKKLLSRTAATAICVAFAGEAMATEWNVSLWGKRRAFTEHVEKLAELVSEKTGGDFTLNISYGGLSKNRENLDGISIGAFEMAQFCAGYHRDKNPSITVMELPFLGVSSLEMERDIAMAVYQHPAVVEDLARWNATLLMPSPLPQYNIVGVGDAPATLADFEGMSVRATGGIGAAMETVGAVPTSMSATEVRQAMDSGVVKAVSFAPHAHMSFGTVENAEWWTTNLNPGTVNCPVVANSDALADLSDAHREALTSSIDEALNYYIESYNTKTMDAWGPLLEEKGITQVTFTDGEIAAFKEAAAAPAANAWIEANTAAGLPAQELYDLVTGMVAEGM
ncbi:TRAP transporter substrate-binding protein DctP [Thalassobium sp. R2A62]|jgi:TRAP-type C4-dicarboxylate transport system substrate-binding protein|uniref:TRAP transporter substrate-binding protein DctP n=1 Tax=Thalassobium sp. R2A62 TaxID=633131 RepID=UPI0001B1CFAE|nr:TRAP transporter substrate-binding protein DctP [Thalassobium sp. R2A62]EET46718.1 trap dicarboxylate transporter- dctp subunit [Thalassobium sp. R2A62]MDG1339232.1 TRAP transporter substrate-binding protein DctP [Paracoccaceae bacterium]MDG1801204.1 TRAP transporter substrate-binding protein DctP [Paracoccaceae bacterium]MDG2451605.1 TRAP transporter substrate-binding protein DctP [Paracoccaceae bacterium]